MAEGCGIVGVGGYHARSRALRQPARLTVFVGLYGTAQFKLDTAWQRSTPATCATSPSVTIHVLGITCRRCSCSPLLFGSGSTRTSSRHCPHTRAATKTSAEMR